MLGYKNKSKFVCVCTEKCKTDSPETNTVRINMNENRGEYIISQCISFYIVLISEPQKYISSAKKLFFQSHALENILHKKMSTIYCFTKIVCVYESMVCKLKKVRKFSVYTK